VARAVLFCYLATLVVWFLFFYVIAWSILKVPMGLGGALFPGFFTIPVLVSLVAYEFLLSYLSQAPSRQSLRTSELWRIAVPMILLLVALVLTCPMDEPRSFISAFVEHLRTVR
jgi:hypothetical protein